MILDSRILWSSLKTKNVTVSVMPQPVAQFLIFQVAQMADLGPRNQKIFLKSLFGGDVAEASFSQKNKLSLPTKIERLEVVYSGRPSNPVGDVYETIVMMKGKSCIEKIVPDVLAPGDFVLFKIGAGGQVRFVEALRAMTIRQLMNCKPSRIAHAL